MNAHSIFCFLMAQAGEAAAPAAQTAPPWTGFVPMLIIGVIFYFALIRPQMKARKQQENLVASAKTGDQVVTTGGIVGVISNLKDKTVIVRTGDNVKLEILKTHLASVTKPVENQPASA